MKITKIIAISMLCVSSHAWSGSKNFFDIFNEWYVEEPRERESLKDALLEGDFEADLRLRYEDVEEQLSSSERGAQALTLRSQFRYESMQYELLSMAFGFIDNRAIPDDSSYDSVTNDESDDARILDPETTELNEAWLSYDIINTVFKYGRQPVEWNNGRFIGTEDWRQLGQSFSGLTVKNEFLNYVRFQFAQLHRIESVLGEDAENADQNIDATLFNVQYRGILNSVLSIYSYDIDNESGNDLWDSHTYGVRFWGDIQSEPIVEYAFEYAKQKDDHDNPNSYSADYSLLELGVTHEGVRVAVGREKLGEDGDGFFVMPLGSKHAFQGFADQFAESGLGNIPGGIKDNYYSLGYVFSKEASIIATMHSFETEDKQSGLGSLGDELDIEAKYSISDYDFILKYSDYEAVSLGNDISKLWLSASMKL